MYKLELTREQLELVRYALEAEAEAAADTVRQLGVSWDDLEKAADTDDDAGEAAAWALAVSEVLDLVLDLEA